MLDGGASRGREHVSGVRVACAGASGLRGRARIGFLLAGVRAWACVGASTYLVPVCVCVCVSPVTGRERVAGVLVSLPARVFGIATAGLRVCACRVPACECVCVSPVTGRERVCRGICGD